MEFKGWAFVEIGTRGELRRHGHVIDKLSEGVYLVQVYANEFTAAEPVKAEEMLSWKMFPDQTEMKRYIDANMKAAAQRQAEAEQPDGVKTNLPITPEIERVPKEDGEPSSPDSDDLLGDADDGDHATDKGQN